MYTLTQKSMVIDQLMLEKDNGQSEILDISLKITPELVRQYRRIQVEMIEAERGDKTDPENVEKVGRLVMEVMCLLFGESNTVKILDFYRDDISLALAEVFPYIQDVIVPKFKAVAKERKKALRRSAW
jgi:hypothetical protein